MRQAIALIRVSTEAQATEDRAGLASQRRECQKIAEREGLTIVEWVELAGVSGAKVLADPRFVSLLDRLPGVHGLIVTAQDRLMRPEGYEDYAILGRIHRAGCLLYTPAGARDLGRDRLLTMLESEIAHYERVRIRERTMKAKAEHRRRGRHVAGPEALPYGVRFDLATGAWSYAPAEAEVVREVFARVLGGERDFSALARSLGIERTLVHRILSQPIYAGFRYIDAAGRVVRAQGEEQVIFEVPIVSREAWEAAHAIAAARQPAPRGAGPGLYRGFVRCAHCGRPMHVHAERHGATYRCRGGVQLAYRALDAAADAAVAGRLARPDVLEAALLECTKRTERTTRGDVEAEAKRLREERERVALAFERGMRTLPDAERRFREIDGHLRRLERAAAERPEPADPRELALRLAEPFAEWAYLAAGQKRRILAAAVEWVCVARTGRARAAVEAIRLRLPVPGGPHRPSRPALSDVGRLGWLEVRL